MEAQNIIIREIIKLESELFAYEKRAFRACEESDDCRTLISDASSKLKILKDVLGKIKKNK